jgi:hypothetical protein
MSSLCREYLPTSGSKGIGLRHVAALFTIEPEKSEMVVWISGSAM